MIRVLIIGGDQKVATLINVLKGIKGIDLIGVCDSIKDSTGMIYAAQMGVEVSTDLSDMVSTKNADIIIETSGSREFQKVLSQIAPPESRIIDSKAAELLLQVAQEKEEARRYGQLYLVNKLSGIFAAEFDTHNIARPIFNLLKDNFDVDLVGITVFYASKDELTIASDFGLADQAMASLIDCLKKETALKLKREVDENALDIFSMEPAQEKKEEFILKSHICIPLTTSVREEGVMFVASSKENSFKPEDIIFLNIIAGELALFIENERMKKDLADSKDALESMLKSMSEGVIALDKDNRVILLNSAARLLLGLGDVYLGKPLWDSFKNREVLNLVKSSIEDQKLQSHQISFAISGAQRTVKVYIAPVIDSLGNSHGHIMLLSDITKEKEVDRMKSEFISTTSHELRTPLAAIKESVMLVLDGTTGELSLEQNRFLNIAKRNIDRLVVLVSDLLDLSKIESGKMRLSYSKCAIEEVINRALESMYILAKENKVELLTEIEKGLPLVDCDPDKIVQIVVNLVSNALKFTSASGSVKVSCSLENGSQIKISVSDTGIGIAQEDITKLFNRFDQLDASLTRRPGGTGLGLAICKELVRMHGGQIWVESESGKGSIFIFTIPIEKKA